MEVDVAAPNVGSTSSSATDLAGAELKTGGELAPSAVFVEEVPQEDLFAAAEAQRSSSSLGTSEGARQLLALQASGSDPELSGLQRSEGPGALVSVVSCEGPLDFFWHHFHGMGEASESAPISEDPAAWGGPLLELREAPGGPLAGVVNDRPEVAAWMEAEQIRRWMSDGLQ
jgi:hypothetical protein